MPPMQELNQMFVISILICLLTVLQKIFKSTSCGGTTVAVTFYGTLCGGGGGVSEMILPDCNSRVKLHRMGPASR